MKHLIIVKRILLCVSIIPFLFSCNKDNPEVYDNILIINGQTYNPIISSVENDDPLTIKLFTPYDDSFTGTLLINNNVIGHTIDLNQEQDSFTLSYNQKENVQTDLKLESGTMNVDKAVRYGIRIEAKDINGKRFYLCIVPDGLTLHDNGRWF